MAKATLDWSALERPAPKLDWSALERGPGLGERFLGAVAGGYNIPQGLRKIRETYRGEEPLAKTAELITRGLGYRPEEVARTMGLEAPAPIPLKTKIGRQALFGYEAIIEPFQRIFEYPEAEFIEAKFQKGKPIGESFKSALSKVLKPGERLDRPSYARNLWNYYEILNKKYGLPPGYRHPADKSLAIAGGIGARFLAPDIIFGTIKVLRKATPLARNITRNVAAGAKSNTESFLMAMKQASDQGRADAALLRDCVNTFGKAKGRQAFRSYKQWEGDITVGVAPDVALQRIYPGVQRPAIPRPERPAMVEPAPRAAVPRPAEIPKAIPTPVKPAVVPPAKLLPVIPGVKVRALGEPAVPAVPKPAEVAKEEAIQAYAKAAKERIAKFKAEVPDEIEIAKVVQKIIPPKTTKPHWAPLELVMDRKWMDGFMSMGSTKDLPPKYRGEAPTEIFLYKHGITRKYINLDREGNAYKYVSPENKYVKIPLKEAMTHVFKGLEEMGWKRETAYDAEFIARKDKELRAAGWTIIRAEPGKVTISKKEVPKPIITPEEEIPSVTPFQAILEPGKEWKTQTGWNKQGKPTWKTMTTEKAQTEILKSLRKQGIEPVVEETPEGKIIIKTPQQARLDQMYEEGKARQKPPGVGLSLEQVSTVEGKKQINQQWQGAQGTWTRLLNEFSFYKDAPPAFRNAIRTQLIGGLNNLKKEVYTKTATALWGGLKPKEVEQSVELIYARNQASRVRAGKGDPRLTVEQADALTAKITAEITNPEIIAAADRWRVIANDTFEDLVRRGKLAPENKIEDYAPIFVVDYTPPWHFNVTIPTRLKRPYRGYVKKAVGTTKESRQDAEALLGHLLRVRHDNLIEDFIRTQGEKHDYRNQMTKAEQMEMFGSYMAFGKYPTAKYPKSGKIYDIEGKKYRGYNPNLPFIRQTFPLEVEDKVYQALGKYSLTYLLPENVYKTFMRFSEKGGPLSPLVYLINQATGVWKSMAILSRFAGFNFNNLIGDTWMMAIQSPHPTKVMNNVEPAVRFLSTPATKYTPEQVSLNKFLIDNAILDSAFIATELPIIRKAKNPITYLIQKAQQVSEFREEIMRTAQAAYFLQELKQGRGEAIRQHYNWINTDELTLDAALGKIARDTMIDYNAMSKTYRRLVRGFVFPFGTWYFKGTNLMWRYHKYNPLRAIWRFLWIPIVATAWNMIDKGRREMEEQLPDYVRHRVHFILGKTKENNIKVWSMQLPQDVLIGTKIYSIAVNEATRVMAGEKTVQQAAKDAIKAAGIKEAKGIAYLTTPYIRFIRGLILQRDPYDMSPIYPTDVRRMDAMRVAYHQGLFMTKCMVPFLSMYIRDYAMRGRDAPSAMKDVLKNIGSTESLGIFDVSPKTEIILPDGTKYDYDMWLESRDKGLREEGIFLDIVDGFIRTGVKPEEYYQSPAFQKQLKKLQVFYADRWSPELGAYLTKRIQQRIENNPKVIQLWAQNNYERAKTQQEKMRWSEVLENIRKGRLFERKKRLKKGVR